MKPKPNEVLRAVAEDIIKTKFISDDQKKEIANKFYKIMRKHGIKHGTKVKDGGITCANFEWTLCQQLFQDRVRQEFDLLGFFGIPINLQC